MISWGEGSAAERMSTDKRLRQLDNVFAVFDLDGSSKIESTELLVLGKMRRQLGQKETEWSEAKNRAMIERMDANLDGLISCSEFSARFEKALTKDNDGFQTLIDQFMAVAKECRANKEKARAAAQAVARKKKEEYQAKQLALAEEKIRNGQSPEGRPPRGASQTPKATPEPKPKTTPRPAPEIKPIPKQQAAPEAAPKAEPEAVPEAAPKAEPEAVPKAEPKAVPKAEPRTAAPTRSNTAVQPPPPSKYDKQARLTKLNSVFAVFDLDNSGQIESNELLQLGKMRRSLGQKNGEWSDEQNARLVKKMDVNNDGKTSANEFSTHFEKTLTKDMAEFGVVVEQFLAVATVCRAAKKNGPHPEKFERLSLLDDVFEMLDLDHGGLLERGEVLQLGKVRHEMGLKPGLWCEDQNTMMVGRMDKDNDGMINCLEFSTHFERVLPRNMNAFKHAIDEYMQVARACSETDSYTIYSRIRSIKKSIEM